MEEYNIKKTLRQCKRAATIGYKLSVKQYKNLTDIMRTSSDKIEKTLIDINNTDCYVSEATDSLADQLAETRIQFDEMSISLMNDLSDLREKLSTFSITLFGKTMAGKSTLMEIFTEGDGQSIGKGSQRTTRDVRKYIWNNLEITDVPGIGAFDGEDDEQIAFSAAKQADLILFLITDDAPQAAEAQCLSELIRLGKPILCVLNVKSAIRKGENPKLTIWNIKKAFNPERLEKLKSQFLAYASLDGEVWDDIPIISTHLKAAFMSQNTADPGLADELHSISQIDSLTAKIIEEVETHGKYYREKNFIDLVSVSSLEIYEDLLFKAYINTNLCRIVAEKRSQLDNWISKFQRDAISEMESLISGIEADLKLDIPSFAEEHFDDKDVVKTWEKLLERKRLGKKCEELSSKMSLQADDRLKELAREITNEMTYVSIQYGSDNINIPQMHKIVDVRKIWKWGTLIVESGLLIAGMVLGSEFLIPITIASIGVAAIGGIGAHVLKSKGKKEDEARKELEAHLLKNVDEICNSLKDQLNLNLERIIKDRLYAQSEELKHITDLIEYLSDTQNELASNLRPSILEQSKQILGAALKLVSGGRYLSRVGSAARIPGKLMVAQMVDGERFPDKIIERLKLLIQEELLIINYTSDIRDLIDSLLGSTINNCTITSRSIILDLNNHSQSVMNKVKALQQFIGSHIEIKKETKNA